MIALAVSNAMSRYIECARLEQSSNIKKTFWTHFKDFWVGNRMRSPLSTRNA